MNLPQRVRCAECFLAVMPPDPTHPPSHPRLIAATTEYVLSHLKGGGDDHMTYLRVLPRQRLGQGLLQDPGCFKHFLDTCKAPLDLGARSHSQLRP